jgi:hypothetical protein
MILVNLYNVQSLPYLGLEYSHRHRKLPQAYFTITEL